MPGLFIETSLLFPIAAIWMIWLIATQQASLTAGDGGLSALLILGGPVTVLPLLFFAIAAKRVTLTTIGFMQFLAPTLQFFTGLYYGERLTTAHLVCFGRGRTDLNKSVRPLIGWSLLGGFAFLGFLDNFLGHVCRTWGIVRELH
jgi:hypothetical protein